MTIFFYGEDEYRLHEQLEKIKAKFISASLGDTNLSIIDAKTAKYDEIVRQILALPFLAKSRLIIIENILSDAPRDLQEKIGDFLGKIPKTSIVVFTQLKADKRLGLYKKLLKADKVAEFPELEPEQIKRWIRKKVEGGGGEIESEAINRLLEFVGNDLWRMSQEIDKLLNYQLSITEETIKLLVIPQVEADIFRLTDAIAAKNLAKALRETQALQEKGENELYILSMIVFQLRNLLILKDLEENYSLRNQWELAKKSGLHPYVVGKTIKQLPNFTFDELKRAYRLLLDYDSAIKRGKIEGKTALVLLLAKLIA